MTKIRAGKTRKPWVVARRDTRVNMAGLMIGRARRSLGLVLIAVTCAATCAQPAVFKDGGLGSFFIDGSGQLWSWGRGLVGAHGLGDYEYRFNPVRVPGMTNMLSVASGDHVLALDGLGQLWVWGANDRGQLGLGDNVNRTTPVAVPGMTSVVVVTRGNRNSFVLDASGHVWSCGINDHGQLGLGDTVDRSSFTLIPNVTFVDVAAGGLHAVGLDAGGQIWTWGRNTEGQLGLGDNVERWSPTVVPGMPPVQSIQGGDGHALVADNVGQLWSWGYNHRGQLGQGHQSNTNAPGLVTFPAPTSIAAMVAGTSHNLAIDTTGQLWSWGKNDRGQLGLGDLTLRLTPMVVPGLACVTQVAASQTHSMVLDASDRLWGFGESAFLGIGYWCFAELVPVAVTALNPGFRLTMTLQPGATVVEIANRGGPPGAPYFTAITNDFGNYCSPTTNVPARGTGWFGGLHIPAVEVLSLAAIQRPPIQGNLDVGGNTTFGLPVTVIPTPLTVFAVTHALGPGLQIQATAPMGFRIL